MTTLPSKLSLHEHQRQHPTHNFGRPMLHVQAPVNFTPPKQTGVSRMSRTTLNLALPRLDTKISPVQKRSQTTPRDHTNAMMIHCHPELGERSPDSGGSWIRPSMASRPKVTAQTQDDSEVTLTLSSLDTPLTSRISSTSNRFFGYFVQEKCDEVEHENCIDSSVAISTAPLPGHHSNPDSTRAPTETAIAAHSFDVPPHQTSPLGFPARSSTEAETVAEIRGTEDSPTLRPSTSLQNDEPDELPLMCSRQKAALEFDTDRTDLLGSSPSPITSVVNLPLTIHFHAGTSTFEFPTLLTVNGTTPNSNGTDDDGNGEAEPSQQQATSSSSIDTDIPIPDNLSVTAQDLSPLTQTGHADLAVAIEDPPASILQERDAQRAEQTDACTQEPDKLMTLSIPKSESGPGFADDVGGRLEETPGFPVRSEALNPSILNREPAQNSSTGKSNENPLLAITGGMNIDTPTSLTNPSEPSVLKVTNHSTSFESTSWLCSHSNFDTVASSAATTSSASFDCQAECEITASNIAANSGQEQFTSCLSCSCLGLTSIQALPDLEKMPEVLSSSPSNRKFDILSLHPSSSQDDSPGRTPDSNAVDGVSPASQKTKNCDCPSATFGQEHRVPQPITTSNEYKQGSVFACEDASAANNTNRRSLTLGISQLNVSAPAVPKETMVDMVGESEQNDVPVLSVICGSSSSVQTPVVSPHQSADIACSPILPPLPESCTDFGDVLRLLSPDKDDICAEKTAVSTSHLTTLFIPGRAHTETVISPTRTSVAQDFEMTERVIVPQDGITRARAASLRFHNKKLEDECNGWRQKHDELERKYRELEKDLEKGLAGLAAVGAEWLPRC